MKKEKVYRLLYAVSALLVLGFVIRFGVDIYKYNTAVTGSAPLYAYAIIRFAEFIIPSVIIFTVTILVKNKLSKEEKKAQTAKEDQE